MDAVFKYDYARFKCSVMAFNATTMVDNDIIAAPTAGLRMKPTGAKIPAASGIAKML
jgi:hypothetical protein